MDPAFESEALQEFVEFLNSCHLAEEAKTSLVRAMETRPKLPHTSSLLCQQTSWFQRMRKESYHT